MTGVECWVIITLFTTYDKCYINWKRMKNYNENYIVNKKKINKSRHVGKTINIYVKQEN